jgi:hypothetical protein
MTPAEKIATLLDEKRPNWYNEVDTKTLDMDSAQECLMGQLYGQYNLGMAAVGLTVKDGWEYGVCISDVEATDPNTTDDMLEAYFDAENERMKDAIIAEIEARRSFDRGVEAMTSEARKLELESVYA